MVLWIDRFPRKARSFDDFMRMVSRKDGTVVVARAGIRLKNGAFTASVGYIGNFEYFTNLRSCTERGRPIVYNEVHASRYGSDYEFGDSEDRLFYALKGLLTADVMLQKVREKRPQAKTELMNPDEILGDEVRVRMYDIAKQFGIKPFYDFVK